MMKAKYIIAGDADAKREWLARELCEKYPDCEFEAGGISAGARVVLAVSLMDGPMPATRAALAEMREKGASLCGFALTRRDEFDAQSRYGAHIKELVGVEARELASLYGFDDDAIPLAEFPTAEG